MSMSEVDQVNLARIVVGGANGKTEFRAVTHFTPIPLEVLCAGDRGAVGGRRDRTRIGNRSDQV